jgi:GH15 family glucan-1,4-alpha-glucosidase
MESLAFQDALATHAKFVNRRKRRLDHSHPHRVAHLSDITTPARSAPKIQDYAIIGDCRAAALVSKDGSIDWLCWPRFDSEAVFAAILDYERGGFWSISPVGPYRTSRSYDGDSNVLRTRFEGESGSVILTDLMPVVTEDAKDRLLIPDHEIIRELHCTLGAVEMAVHFEPRPSYGKSQANLRDSGKLGIRLDLGYGVYYLRSSCPMRVNGGVATAGIKLREGDSVQFSLTYSEESPVVLPPLGDWSRQRIDVTKTWWQDWAAAEGYDGEHRASVVRSALALKLLTYAPSGAVVAAATTSLPERIGGSLNWDYRFCWLRDASLTVRAMLGLGYYAEADAFINWLLHATALTRPELRILYTVFGENAPKERTLPFLRGYRGSSPVRVGNAARSQLQLDVYGEVIDAVAQYANSGAAFDRTTQKVLIGFGDYVVKNWSRPDEGIWEPRSGPQKHTHSRLLCWTALDRLIKLQQQGAITGAPVDEYAEQRQAICREIKEYAWNERLRSYVSVLEGDSLDASLLLLSYYGFEDPRSDRMQSTYRALRNQLGAGDLMYRYDSDHSEGAFAMCSFWEVEFLALGGGSLKDADDLFRRLIGYGNDVGLFAEEINPDSGDALGNFPQAFTHVGLISAALAIKERQRGEKSLPHRESSAEENHAAGMTV